MRGVWATLLSVWALFAVVAVLAWTRQRPAVRAADGPDLRRRHDQEREAAARRPAQQRDEAARHDPNVAGAGRMIEAAATGVPVAWLIARAAGLVAFGLLTLSVWLGLSISTRLLAPRHMKSLVAWHQTLVWTAVGMFALHGLALLLDPTLHFGFLAVLVPGAAPWRPLAVSAGVVTGWLMLLLAVSFRYRRRIGQKNWRRFHYAAFAAFSPRPRSRPDGRQRPAGRNGPRRGNARPGAPSCG